MKINIVSRWDSSVLFTAEAASILLALEAAIKSGADLRSADLRSADLRSANLSGANLYGADLRSADLSGANLPSPTTILLANWGTLSDSLTADLMEYDSSNHPERAAFDRWVEGGPCPYEGIRVQRAARFTENKKVWGTGTLKSAYALMLKLFEESDIKF